MEAHQGSDAQATKDGCVIMTRNEIRKAFPQASAAFIQANAEDIPARICDTQPESNAWKTSPGADQDEETGSRRFAVSIERIGLKLLDEDNLTGGCKLLLDAMRRAQIIPDDDPGSISLKVTQRPSPRKADHGTWVTVDYFQ